ncbi:hypothetical protein HY385_02685 [Candidatus Daviesbacteria bacterium]|nr:hypothetical protein [Candidatus Daviesbacteria bacterium]
MLKKEHQINHKQWFLGMPTDYYFAIVVSLLVILPISALSWWFTNITLFGFQTIIIILFSLYVLKIDKWHTTN